MGTSTKGHWVVLKFGGTSVSSRDRWQTIATVVRKRIAEGLRPVVVCSAFSGVTNQLEQLLEDAVGAKHEPLLAAIERHHQELGTQLGVDTDPLLAQDLAELNRLASGAALLQEASPRVRAQVLAKGELLSTRLGAAYLEGAGLKTSWIDARTCLEATPEPTATAHRHYLSGACDLDPDPALAQRLATEPGDVLLTQGFIARDHAGETVLLGRGGSDTSAAYFAARLGAVRCEIWTDVPGMFTCNPRLVPEARLLRSLDYQEAQEIASTGARIIHPRCIAPLAANQIPLHIRATPHPDEEGTVVSAGAGDKGAWVKAISSRQGITLVSMETDGMWQRVGFLADVFACFKDHGLSVDLVSTSEMNVTVSLDPAANAIDSATIKALLRDLDRYCVARAIGPCASVSLVGRNIRAVLPHLGPALEVFAEQKIHLLTQAASDLNLTFVVDERQSQRLARRLHELLYADADEDPRLGPTWRELQEGPTERPAPLPAPWWHHRREDLLALAREQTPLYVYDTDTLDAAVSELDALQSVERVYYAIKANPHPDILRRFEAAGLGFECVSPGEVDHVRTLLPDLDAERILFTPNFAGRAEYEHGFAQGVHVTVDNVFPLQAWPEVFRGQKIFLRLDPGHGRGHHAHVKTAGSRSKFGISADQLEGLTDHIKRAEARVVGLHAHAGSGILTPGNWSDTALFLIQMAERFDEVRTLDLGGGLGVVERPGQQPLDLSQVNDTLSRIRQAHPRFALWLEPGRFLVARAGVLLASVTQLKQKGARNFVGVDAGMNSLIRPALYGAWHEIVNLTRLGDPATHKADIVGPICETGDVLGHDRRIAPASEGDVLLVASGGAYGHAMSSSYNLRAPAAEKLLPSRT